jgi:hypothetical protein
MIGVDPWKRCTRELVLLSSIVPAMPEQAYSGRQSVHEATWSAYLRFWTGEKWLITPLKEKFL